MARDAKEELNLYHFEEEKPKQKRILKSGKITKKGSNKKEETQKQKEELFSFENEMIIGMTKKQEKQQTRSLKTKQGKKKQISSNKKETNKNKKKKQVVQKNKKIKKRLSQEQLEKKQQKRMHMFRMMKYGMLLALFITLIIVAMFSPIFNIKNIVITGNEKISQNEILSLSGIQIEENTFKINKRRIKQQIKENAYIEEVIIKRKLPSEIQIQIQERKTAFLIEYGGSYVYLNEQGYILEISTEKLELPILQGIQTENENFVEGNRLEEIDLQKMNTVLKIMEIAQNNEIANLITKIDIEDEKNYKISFDTKEKTAHVGDNTNLNTKILTIKAILEKTEGLPGDIFVDMDLNNNYPVFRQRV